MELIRLVDSISRDKNIDKELIYGDIEMAMISAARKAYGVEEEVEVEIDRVNGQISARIQGKPVEMKTLGRIAAQTAKQVMIQRIREAERSSIFEEFSERVGTVVTGTVSRFERGALLINLGRTEGILPRSEQIPGESHHPGERVRAMILDVHEAPHQVKIVLTRTHPDYIRRLFELEVPEVADRIIEIRALAREAGYRTKVAVASIDIKVDAVGACVGVRGSRIRNIVDELGGEKIDIVRWNESSQILIGNALKPAEIQEVALCFELGRATVVVAEDQLSLAIGKRGQNVRLAARLTGWDIDILTPTEYNKGLDDLMCVLREVEGIEDVHLDQLLALGIVSLGDVKEVGTEPLTNELKLDEELAQRVVETAGEAAARIEREDAEAKIKAEAEAKEKAEQEAKEKAEAEAAAACQTEAADGTFESVGSTHSPDELAAGALSPDSQAPGDAQACEQIAAGGSTAAGTDQTAPPTSPPAPSEESDVTPAASDGAISGDGAPETASDSTGEAVDATDEADGDETSDSTDAADPPEAVHAVETTEPGALAGTKDSADTTETESADAAGQDDTTREAVSPSPESVSQDKTVE